MNKIYFGVAMILMCALNASAEPSIFLNNGVTAHRGDSGAYPENTMPAFKSALVLGVDWIELDVLRTKDGQLVVIHDVTTEAVGDRVVNVNEENYTDLQEIDVAFRFRERKKLTLNESPKETMPLLYDVLRLMRKQYKTRVSIQPKDECTEQAVAMVKALKMEAWVGFNASFDVDKDIAIALDRGFESLVIHVDGVTQETIDKIHAAGLEVGAWTVNDAATMQRLLDMGVDRIYTDEPGRLLALKQESAHVQD